MLFDLLSLAHQLTLKEKCEVRSDAIAGAPFVVPGSAQTDLLFLRTKSQGSRFGSKS